MFVYIHAKYSGFTIWIVWKALRTHQMEKKGSGFVGLVGLNARWEVKRNCSMKKKT